MQTHQRITLRLIAEAEQPCESYAKALKVAAVQAGVHHGVIDLLERYAETIALAEEAKLAAKSQANDAKSLWEAVVQSAKSGPDMADMAMEGGR